jgi:hypothetical protein
MRQKTGSDRIILSLIQVKRQGPHKQKAKEKETPVQVTGVSFVIFLYHIHS